MAKLSSNDILPLIYRYLIEIGMAEVATKIKKSCGFDLESIKKGIASKKLRKICKFYLKHHPFNFPNFKKLNLIRKLQENQSSEGNEVENEESPEINEEKNVNKKPSRESEKNNNKSEETEEKEEESPIKDEENDIENDQNVTLQQASKKISKKNFFQRIDHSRAHELKTELKDNTFLAKFKFGHGDEFGKLGHEKLKDTRGRGFKKEKSKLKNKQFQGGGFKIDIHARNSIKL